ncbi:MAG: S-methyl-5-thioribose-1-phosphate isomerase, partial [Caloramator sp.]|nr:S-methyl-5-thioribose-1-phosphate isomerase [Caloramator sp.]
MEQFRTIEFKDGILKLIDQRKLPLSLEIFECRNYREVDFAIKDMVVRGAPAIGVTAAYGVYLAALEYKNLTKEEFLKEVLRACDILYVSRPTAVNLMWAINRMRGLINTIKEDSIDKICEAIKDEADKIAKEDENINKKIAEHGNKIIPQNGRILTHCNTGALATSAYGTALGVIREAHYSGKNIFVYADETRPRLQGARLTAFELVQEKIPAKLIPDNAAATLIRDGKVDVIIVGAD